MASPEATSTVPTSGSPTTYKNETDVAQVIVVSGGLGVGITVSRDGVLFLPTGLLTGQVVLAPGDSVRVAYATPPTLTKFPLL